MTNGCHGSAHECQSLMRIGTKTTIASSEAAESNSSKPLHSEPLVRSLNSEAASKNESTQPSALNLSESHSTPKEDYALSLMSQHSLDSAPQTSRSANEIHDIIESSNENHE